MQISAEKLCLHLKSHGRRLTKARRAVIEYLFKVSAPVTAVDIIENLHNKGLQVNKTTVYRELEFLVKMNVVNEVSISKQIMHYEVSHLDHHHHLVCDKCGCIQEVDTSAVEMEMTKLESRVLGLGFKIDHHNLEFFGTCADCK